MVICFNFVRFFFFYLFVHLTISKMILFFVFIVSQIIATKSTQGSFIFSNKTSPSPKMKTLSIPIGIADFKTLRLESDFFVDKSFLARQSFRTKNRVDLVIRPRSWGKSLNLNMLKRFFEIEIDKEGNRLPIKKRINRKLFFGGEIRLKNGMKKKLEPLDVVNYYNNFSMKFQGTFPVIFLDLSKIDGHDYDKCVKQLTRMILKLFRSRPYLMKKYDNITRKFQHMIKKYYTSCDLNYFDLINSLNVLSQLLYKHFGRKVLIYIDNYDHPFVGSYVKFGSNHSEIIRMRHLMTNLFRSTFLASPFLMRGFLTGVLPVPFGIREHNSNGCMNDLKFHKCYGFNEKEVTTLLFKSKLTVIPTEIDKWYGGYSENGKIFNPSSTMKFFENQGIFTPYWMNNVNYDIFINLIKTTNPTSDFRKLLKHNCMPRRLCPILYLRLNTIHEPLQIKSMLYYAGFMTILEKNCRSVMCLPNMEVRALMDYLSRTWSLKN